MSVADFAALPPEVNSGRMYAGAGAGPLTAAAVAWDRLAAELSSAASSYRAQIVELTDEAWSGPASAAMTAAVAPYAQWMDTTAAQAAQTANQARAAATAYQEAFAATVPPPAIAANRTSLASLVTHNIVGQNAHAIAANQAQYAEMWTQDATAMHGYHANSAAAATLTPFTPAPQAGNPTVAQSTQGDTLLERLGEFLSTLGTTGIWKQMLDFVQGTPMQYIARISLLTTGFQASIGGLGFQTSGITLLTAVPENAALAFFIWWLATQNALGELGLAGTGSAMAGTGSAALASSGSALGASGLAGLGRAASIGGLSVPPSWGASARDIQLAATALPAAGSAAFPQAGGAGPGMFGGIPPVGSMVNASKTGESGSRYGARPKVVARMPGETGSPGDTSDRRAAEAASVLSERNELDKLRKEIIELAKERDVLTRSADKLIKQAAEL